MWLEFQHTEKNWKDDFHESFEETPLFVAITTYLGYALLVIVGHIRDFLRFYSIEKQKTCTEPRLKVSVWRLLAKTF